MKTTIQIDDNYKNWLEELSDSFKGSLPTIEELEAELNEDKSNRKF